MTPIIEPSLKNTGLGFQELYAKLTLYAAGNGIYDAPSLTAVNAGQWQEAMKPLRNVAPRSVEFYANKTLPGPIQIITENENLKAALEQILTWSNFNEKKQLYLRDLAKLGDVFFKVQFSYEGEKADKVFLYQINAENVVDFEEDERGFLKSIRVETTIPVEGGGTTNRIEYWTKDPGTEGIPYWAIWETDQKWPVALDQLGAPVDYGSLAEYGIDFVPFVHIKFHDVGDLRGQGCFTHTLDKIDEANRQATRLAQMVFKRASGVWQIQTDAFDKDNRPLATPPLRDKDGAITNTLEISDDVILRMPAGSQLVSTIPPIAWEAIRQIANDMVEELKEDMPELRYYSQTQGANLSGKALTMILSGALDRAREAGENFTTGLSRALMMGLTMAQFMGILQVNGSYEAGSFDHEIEIPDVFEPDNAEKAQTFSTLAQKLDNVTALKLAGFPDEVVQEAQDAATAEEQRKADLAIRTVRELNANKP